MNDPMRFAVIGCGVLARSKHIAHIAASDRMILHTCCDLSDEALKICSDEFQPLHLSKDFRETIANPEVDALVLATTESLRKPAIQAAADAGKPIYVEKPMAPTLGEAYEIQKIVKDSGIPFCVGHNRRSSPAMIEAHAIFRQHIEDPKPCPWRYQRETDLPELADDDAASMTVRINDDWRSWKGFVFDPELSLEGPMLFEMTHFTDLCNWFMDSPPIEVSAMDTGMLNHGVIIRYANHEIATIMMTGNGSFGYPKELYELMGAGGFIAIDHMLEVRTVGIEGAPARKIYPMLTDRHPDAGKEGGLSGYLAKKQVACAEAVEQGDTNLIFTAEPDKGHAHALDRFIDEIHGNGPKVCSVDEALLATRVAFAAIQSAKQHCMINMKDV
jgi:predicted dehydrogenase